MSFWDFARGPASARLMLAFGMERGLSEAALLARSRIQAQQLDDPNTELDALQELRVAENLLRLTGHPPGLGLEVGLRFRFSTFGLWGYGLVCSATLGEGMERALRFIQLSYAYSVIDRVFESELCRVRFRPPALATGLSRFLVERDIGGAAALLSEFGGPSFRLTGVELQRGRGRAFRPSSVVTSVLGATPRLDADGYSLTFPMAWLDHKLPNANLASAALCDDMCAKLVAQRRVRAGTAMLVEQVLAASAAQARPKQGQLARLTSTSERTLRRRLQGEGTSFRAIVNTAQAQTAADLLRDPTLSVSAIAERLGYADLSSFSQAFKRWHGLSPMAYRRTLR